MARAPASRPSGDVVRRSRPRVASCSGNRAPNKEAPDPCVGSGASGFRVGDVGLAR